MSDTANTPPSHGRGEDEPLVLTIAIPTYQRPERLTTLLDAIPPRLAEAGDRVRAEVLVIDNDPGATARDAARMDDTPLRYVVEKTPGIAAARNRALDESRHSDLLAFIDDDELPRDGWLSHLLDTWEEHRSAAVMGRVISVFSEDVDPWIVATGTFRRPPRPTGLTLTAAAAGNLLLDLRQVRRLGVRFDERLGLGGGEDTLFSRQLIQRGGRIVWCNESETEDFVVSSRLTPQWVRQRAFSSANAWARVSLLLEPRPVRRVLLRASFLVGGIARIGAGAGRHLIGRATRSLAHDARGVRLLHRGRGMVTAAFGHRYDEYRR